MSCISLAFDAALPCYLEEGVLVNVTLRWSQFQQDGQLIWRHFDFQFYRSCTPNNAKSTIAGLHKLATVARWENFGAEKHW